MALTALSLAIWWIPLRFSFALASSEEQYTNILLILPISATLIFLDWKSDWKRDWKLRGPSSASSGALASLFLIIAVLVNVVVGWKAHLSPDIQLATTMLALVVWWIAAFALCFGSRAFRRALFPLCFLLWMVPLPGLVVNSVVALLQHGSATAARWFFAAAGIPAAQRGTLVHIPGLTLEVAPECSSIRSSLMLLVTTMVLAQLLLRSTWRKTLVVAAAIPLSVAKNGLRIFTLGVLATHVDPSFLTGRLHRQGGGIFFLIALAAIFLLLWIVRLGETKKPKLEAPASFPKEISSANA
jgi:exosortase